MTNHGLYICVLFLINFGFPGGTVDTGDLSLILGLGRSLEEVLATHSRILAWKIPWTKESGGLQSMGSQSQAQLSD